MIEELRRFLVVARTRHITKSSETLFITQSALTQSIHRLEKAIGAKLFIQKGRQLHLTPEGESLIILSEKILSLWETAKDQEKRKIKRPSYTIGLFDNAAIHLGKYFQKKVNATDFTIELIIDSSSKLFSQLRLGTIDLAICVSPLEKSFKQEFVCLQQFKEKLFPITRRPLLSQTKNQPFILYNKDSYTRKYIDDTFRRSNLRPSIYAESTSTTFMKELARLGCGVALLPKNVVKDELKHKTLVIQPSPLVWERTFGIYINKQNVLQKHPLIDELIKELYSNGDY